VGGRVTHEVVPARNTKRVPHHAIISLNQQGTENNA
jgi:hypothetical protein